MLPMLSEHTTNNCKPTASEDDLRAFLGWLAGKDMPSVDTYGWLLRCEEWVKTQLSEKGILYASQRSNKRNVKI
jgi:hypothetical protein